MAVSRLILPLLLLVACASASRTLQQYAGVEPEECSGTFTDQWDNDEIECHFCDGQLKCDHEGGTIRSEKIECEFDPGATSNALEFECPVSNGVAKCDWTSVRSVLPGCAYPITRRILEAWIPAD
ncbi:hypothetical protein ACKKBG_A19910 [Auxenochlorella protothecoides x Auxenochlorella symbiontica]